MRRATITIPDDLERQLQRYLAEQDAPPSLTVLVQAALRDYLQNKALEERHYRPARGPLRITPAEQGSGASDVSIDHDKTFAETK